MTTHQLLRLVAERVGVTATDVAGEFSIKRGYAAVALSRLKRKGLLVKSRRPDGCLYSLTPVGESRLEFYAANQFGRHECGPCTRQQEAD